MIDDTTRIQVHALLNRRLAVSRTVSNRQREERLALLEAEFEELLLKDCQRIPKSYLPRMRWLLTDVPKSERLLAHPTMAVARAIGIVFDELMEQPPPAAQVPRAWDCLWCGASRPPMRMTRFCSDEHEALARSFDTSRGADGRRRW